VSNDVCAALARCTAADVVEELALDVNNRLTDSAAECFLPPPRWFGVWKPFYSPKHAPNTHQTRSQTRRIAIAKHQISIEIDRDVNRLVGSG